MTEPPATPSLPLPDAPPGGHDLLTTLFGLSGRVSRGTYALAGFGLVLLKLVAEAALIRLVTGNWLQLLDHVNPLFSVRQRALAEADWLLVPLVLWTLPFLWIGVTMTVRRLVDAELPAALAVLFFVPGINYLLMLALCLLPSRGPGGFAEAASLDVTQPIMKGALLGLAAGLAIALAMVGISVFAFGSYGSTLFAATPFVMGATSGFFVNRDGRRSLLATFGAAAVTVLLAGGVILVFALEGVLCLAMAFPIALVLGLMGAVVGRAVALHGPGRVAQLAALVLALPFLAGFEAKAHAPRTHAITTTVEIDAPPERVWPNVIGFSELPPPPQWFFEAGIAYPERARISGTGVGAVRRCEFSTGAFVEPITVWDEPQRLGFDVTAQPPSMHEWSPYEKVHAPHVEGYLRSVRGEFRLVRLEGGRTRLEGTTFYQVDIAPESYWCIWSDLLLHAIHRRVLAHIKNLSERPGAK
jgi:uncharacterized membrane protein YhaH (DUF805 family)